MEVRFVNYESDHFEQKFGDEMIIGIIYPSIRTVEISFMRKWTLDPNNIIRKHDGETCISYSLIRCMMCAINL